MSKTKDIFIKHKIVKSDGKALKHYCEICDDFTKYKNIKPSIFINDILHKYKNLNVKDNNTNGKVFEYILASVLINENLLPFYMQAKVAFVPNVDYDILLYCKEKGPIVLSAKTSLRERYKQADLEAVALKYVHRKAESFLVTADLNESKNIQNKVITGEVIGINKVVYALSEEFDDLINYLRQHQFSEAGSVEIVKAGVIVK
ncbi:MAG: hypothetical protein IE909_13705 [Campylobacterales bacterium]|nr:hypothetical protein [Campylobacterales bacterium]